MKTNCEKLDGAFHYSYELMEETIRHRVVAAIKLTNQNIVLSKFINVPLQIGILNNYT